MLPARHGPLRPRPVSRLQPPERQPPCPQSVDGDVGTWDAASRSLPGQGAFIPHRRQRHLRLEFRRVFLPDTCPCSPLARGPFHGRKSLLATCPVFGDALRAQTATRAGRFSGTSLRVRSLAVFSFGPQISMAGCEARRERTCSSCRVTSASTKIAGCQWSARPPSQWCSRADRRCPTGGATGDGITSASESLH